MQYFEPPWPVPVRYSTANRLHHNLEQILFSLKNDLLEVYPTILQILEVLGWLHVFHEQKYPQYFPVLNLNICKNTKRQSLRPSHVVLKLHFQQHGRSQNQIGRASCREGV